MVARFFILISIFVSFASCDSDDDMILDELNENRRLWDAAQVKDYSMNERLSCFCGGVLEKVIFVVDNEKDTVVFDESLLFEGYTYVDVLNGSKSIEEAFDFIEELSARDLASLVVEYDETYGYPTLISIDYNKDYVDDEIAYYYTNFEITN